MVLAIKAEFWKNFMTYFEFNDGGKEVGQFLRYPRIGSFRNFSFQTASI